MSPRQAGPIQKYRTVVLPDWIDYNGHMNDGYYAVAFTSATDTVQDVIGLDAAYRQRTHCSIYTVEAHLLYLREVREGANLTFDSYVLGIDAKRLHLFHVMMNADDDYVAATHELMLLHVDQKVGRTAAMPADIVQRAQVLRDEHLRLNLPAQVGSVIRQISSP